jgi:ornithine cyclodeaminase
VATDSVPTAVSDADIICTATDSTVPIVTKADVRPGAHVNAVGSFTSGMHELAVDLVASAFVVVDHRPAALAEAGEIIAALAAGAKNEDDLVEIGELVNGRVAPPSSALQTTIFKSVGVAVQDLVAGARMVAEE